MIKPLRRRPSSRLLVIDSSNRVLLFRFVFDHGPLAGRSYWATPGGGLEAGESFEQAARRELFEEVGIQIDDVGQPVAEREFPLQLLDGEFVTAEERFFLIRVTDQTLSRDRWTPVERQVITECRWWSIEELSATTQTIYPETLPAILLDLPR